jgi:hypothetical protein
LDTAAEFKEVCDAMGQVGIQKKDIATVSQNHDVGLHHGEGHAASN